MASRHPEPVAQEWVSFPGGELEGVRPKALCPACREALTREASSVRSTRPLARTRKTLCFACYRAELDRQRAIAAAGQLDTATDARFQFQLPFESLDRPRLEMLKADRDAARVAQRSTPTGPFVDRRRQAQIEARHALQRIAAGLKARTATTADRVEARAAIASVFHAAELQLPESWIPFVMSR